MIVKSAVFEKSSPEYQQCPSPNKPEYAFIGRSNVGKSSLINKVCNKTKLAKTSSTPGKTQLINHFLINNEWYLVDLPGYGYAKMPIKMKQKMERMINYYLLRRTNLLTVFVLIDSRHKPQENDLKFMMNLAENQLPFSIIFTKADKSKKKQLAESIDNYKKVLLESWEVLPPYFITSAETGEGGEDILKLIEETNKVFISN
ncbi:MAG: YihA family ribosome biogenesis GTP-binding protein [Bacteroidales bacterium]|nr:YihA family ribosome biogenesis GTP-binding protein [Bacteroidales bacterium]